MNADAVIRELLRHVPDGANDSADAAIEKAKAFLKKKPSAEQALRRLRNEVRDWQDALGVGGRPSLDRAIFNADKVLKF